MKIKRWVRPVASMALCAAMVGAAMPAEARSGGSRTGGSGKGKSSATRSSSARSPSASPRTRASGTATYGYGVRRGHGHGHGHRGYYGGYYGAWGYPYYGYGYGWYYGRPHRAVYVVHAGEAANLPAFVETAVRPKRAQLFLDGESLGQARDFNASWEALELKPGRYEFEFRYDGYQTLRLGLDLKPGRAYRIEEELVKGEGLDERSRDLPPLPDPEPLPAPRVESDIEDNSRPTSAVARGLLRLRVEPGDAAIYLDGEFLGQGSELARLRGALPVAVGEHRLEIVRPGYRSVRERIVIGSEEPLVVGISLEREAD